MKSANPRNDEKTNNPTTFVCANYRGACHSDGNNCRQFPLVSAVVKEMCMNIEIESLTGPRLTRKAYTAAILACILIIVVGAIALKGQLRLARLAHVAIDEDADHSLRANRVVVSALQCRRYEKDILLNLNDVPARTDYIHKWTQSWDKLHEDLEHLKAACLLQEEKQKVDGYAGCVNRPRVFPIKSFLFWDSPSNHPVSDAASAVPSKVPARNLGMTGPHSG